ncbi:MAG: 50S ribosomal protein L10 [Candidatus Melainabacteria bacterium]|nr:50S ribosomal protein L10 [Candidatus Melainabacteria bacterium]
MVTKSDKEKTVEELKDKFSRAKSVYSTKQLGLSVEEITNLRNEIRSIGGEFKIAKNTLFRIAAKGTQFEELASDLTGTTAFLFCYEDEVSPASKVKDFSKENEDKVSLEGANIDGQTYDQAQTTKVINLPAKEVLLSQIAGMLVQPTSQIAGMMGASASDIASLLKQLSEKGDGAKTVGEFSVASENKTVESASSASEEESSEGENKE